MYNYGLFGEAKISAKTGIIANLSQTMKMAIKLHTSSLGRCGDSALIRFEFGSIIFEKLSVEVRYGSVRFSKQNNFKAYVKECNYCMSSVCGI